MKGLAVDGYSSEAVRAALHAGTRHVHFRYELLDTANVHLGWLDEVEKANIHNNSLSSVNRTAGFRIRDNPDVNWINDRVRPWYDLVMPDGGKASWPLGIFLLSTPKRRVRSTGTYRDIEAYDQLVVLKDDKVADRYTIAAATNVIEAVGLVLTDAGVTNRSLVATGETLPTARDWPPGTERLTIVNDLLDSINYRSLYFNSAGFAIAEPYKRPDERATEYTYRAGEDSVLAPDLSHELDLFGVPNKWVVVVSEPDRTPLSSTYTNTNPDSPTSTVSRGRTIVDFREEFEATSQAALDAQVARLAFEASQVYEAIDFTTALMPHHEDSDLIELDWNALGARARYVEHTWEMDLKAGSLMSHRIRRVVNV